jgi:Uma2 family endonuclease
MEIMTETAEKKQSLISPQQYLLEERAAIREKTGKHELINGEIIAMSGASVNHNIIAMNLYLLLGMMRKEKNICVFSSDMRVHNPLTNSFCYPDVSVVNGAPLLTDDNKDVLLNPVLLIEVLSESTEQYDRGDKLKIYRSIPTVREYMLIAQNTCNIESYFKTDSGIWIYSYITNPNETVNFQSIGLQITASQVYEGVELNSINTPPA